MVGNNVIASYARPKQQRRWLSDATVLHSFSSNISSSIAMKQHEPTKCYYYFYSTSSWLNVNYVCVFGICVCVCVCAKQPAISIRSRALRDAIHPRVNKHAFDSVLTWKYWRSEASRRAQRPLFSTEKYNK